jgi:hypothetical protein
MAAKRYRVVVEGRLSERFAQAFPVQAVEVGDDVTVLEADVLDQSHLYGLLDRLRDFALELVRVEEVQR